MNATFRLAALALPLAACLGLAGPAAADDLADCREDVAQIERTIQATGGTQLSAIHTLVQMARNAADNGDARFCMARVRDLRGFSAYADDSPVPDIGRRADEGVTIEKSKDETGNQIMYVVSGVAPSRLVDAVVVDPQGRVAGTIRRVMIHRDNLEMIAIVIVAPGERRVVVPFHVLAYRADGAIQSDWSAAELQSLPDYRPGDYLTYDVGL